MTWSIEWIDSFTWSFINLQTWFWGTNNNYNKNLNIEENFPIWEFTTNKKTKVKNTNPDYTVPTWYIWTDFNYAKNTDKNITLPYWFFDSHKTTYITKDNLEFTVPVWFLWNAVIKKKGWWRKIYIKQYTYKEYFEEVFRNNSSKSGSSSNEYNTFINNLLELLIDNNKDQYEIIDDITKNRINLYIKENKKFKTNLELLVKNLKDINKAFKNATKEEKIYIIKYYLNK